MTDPKVPARPRQLMHPRAQDPKFELADAALHAEQEAVVRSTRVVHAVEVYHSGLDEAAELLDAARSKAERGELRISVPVGYLWHREHGLGFDPDLRLQQTIRLIFERFCQLGSARQTLLSLAADGVSFPRPSDGRRMTSFEWTPIRYRNVISILKNPFYATRFSLLP